MIVSPEKRPFDQTALLKGLKKSASERRTDKKAAEDSRNGKETYPQGYIKNPAGFKIKIDSK